MYTDVGALKSRKKIYDKSVNFSIYSILKMAQNSLNFSIEIKFIYSQDFMHKHTQ